MPDAEVTEFENLGGRSVVEVATNEQRQVFLTIAGDTAYQVAWDTCDTCRYLFTKVMPAQDLGEATGPDVASRISESLRDVPRMPSDEALAEMGQVLAPGRYSVALVRLRPVLAMPGDEHDYFAQEAVATWGVDEYFGVPHSPSTPYYRLGVSRLGAVSYGGDLLGVVLGAPLHPPTRDRLESVERYQNVLRAGETRPTALALGLVEDRGPAMWMKPDQEISRHLITTLYILDGHHKVLAAAKEAVPAQFLVFLPHMERGRDVRQYVESGLDLLRRLST